MYSIEKKPYEISLWDDVLTFVGRKEDGTIKKMYKAIDTDFEGEIEAQYYEERKLCIIGSDTMDAPIRAINPKLVSKVNGENTLTFTLYSHYWDEDDGELKWNLFMSYLTNERKVKLKYDDKWYDFIIKNIDEDSSTKAFTYTCKDLFVNELSKTGFELEFDNELGNNMGNLQTLAERVLEGSDWQLKEGGVETILQYIEEPLYEVTFHKVKNSASGYLPSGLKMKSAYGKSGYEIEQDFPYGKKVYVFYSSVRDEARASEPTTRLEFLYDPSGRYALDDKNTIIGYSDNTPNGISNFYIEADPNGKITEIKWEEENDVYLPKIVVNNITYTLTPGISFEASKRGNRLKKSNKTYFDPKLKRTVNVYNNGQVYGYKTTEYVSPATVQSYVANPAEFTSTSGWFVGKSSSGQSFPELSLEVYPELSSANFEDYTGKSYLRFAPVSAGQVLMNSGIQNNRTAIGSFTKGDKYILELTAYTVLGGNLTSDQDVTLEIYEYDFENGVYSPKPERSALFTITRNSTTVGKCICTCNYSLSEKEFKNTRIGLFIKAKKKQTIFVEKLQFYPQKTNASGNEINPDQVFEDGIPTTESVVKELWIYYDKDSEYTSEEDLKPLYKGNEPSANYVLYYGEGNTSEAFEKVRSITAKESNRFNLLQSLCELFECWAQFEIEHERNGRIALDSNYRQKKWISYKQYIGQDNHVGFKYGINLKSIKRTLDSNGAISKIIVKNNANEFAQGGFCSISRAEENQSGDNTIYNFDYYVGQKLISFTTLNNDLYFNPNNNQGYIGYYKALKALNTEGQKLAEELAKQSSDIAKYESTYQAYKGTYEAAQDDKATQEIKFKDLTGVEFSAALPEFQDYDPTKHRTGDNNTTDISGKKWYENKALDWEYYDGDKKKLVDGPPGAGDLARLKWWDSSEAQKIRAAIARGIVVIRDHEKIYTNQLALRDAAIARESALQAEINAIKESKLALNKKFYQKYSRFIQEGSWISEDYIDDNLYYIDALSTLYTSSRPQVNYTIDVVEISQLEGYENFKFQLGDKTYVEDKEFFGWAYEGSNRLYREEVIVSEITIELDSPESNKIKVQNYKTQFEDLFQRVVATTQQVQFSTGEYKRSASIVNEDGTINISTLQNSFANNAFTLQNARDQSVIIGDDGITTTNLSRPSEILRLVSGGIFLSNNGGESWTTGISAGGINASCITTGQLNVSEVNITMGSHAAFRWDKLGISAYRRTPTEGISPGIFTRFDQFGIYGINSESNFDPLKDGNENGTVEGALAVIKDKASFGLTWDGFWLRSNGTSGYVSISSDKDFEVIRTSTIEENGESVTQKIPIIQIGRLSQSDSTYYGLRINDLLGAPVMETNEEGELWLRKKLSVQVAANDNTVEIGQLGVDNAYAEANKVIDANNKFKVYENGHIEGTDAHFSGGSTFQGTITATGGTIGGLTIEEWSELGFTLKITSDKGWVLRENESTELIATLWQGTNSYNNELEYQEQDGTISVYRIEYYWYDDKEMSALKQTGQKYSVSISEEDTSQEYYCKAILSFDRKKEEEA